MIGVAQGEIGSTVNVRFTKPAAISAAVGVYVGFHDEAPVKLAIVVVVHCCDKMDVGFTIVI